MRHEQDRLAAAPELRELVEALVREALVADREHFVDEQHVRIDVDRDGESEPHVHADEYVLTGASMNSRSSAKSTISSKRS